MCGIAAIYSYRSNGPQIAESEILEIRELMRHRGPDAGGHWLADSGRVALGHRRLAIIDVTSGANQPMELKEADLQITFNGEIYNYRELRRKLEQYGHAFRTDSDTEVILHAYVQYGANLVLHLRGMYAFALWDGKRSRMLLARDPLGIKPLYYAVSDERLVAASEVKAVKHNLRGSQPRCSAAEVSFLLWGFVMEPFTFYSNIRSLPAGSTMWIDESGPQPPRCFWALNEILQAAESEETSSAGPSEELLHSLLDETVQAHFVADVPVGVFLSSGVDSGTIMALASDRQGKGLTGITLGVEEYKGTIRDEIPLAATIAETFGAEHDIYMLDQEEFQTDLSRFLLMMDQPSVDGVNVYYVSKAAARTGFKVALSGVGGDEVFGGYPSFRQIPKLVSLCSCAGMSPTLAASLRRVAAPVVGRLSSSKYASIFEYGQTVEEAYFLRRALFLPWELTTEFDPEFLAIGLEELGLMSRLRAETRGLKSSRGKITALETSIYMRNQLLRDADWAGMAHSIEIRVPFVDAKFYEGMSRFIVSPTPPGKLEMATCLPSPLPDSIVNRPKTGFSVPVRNWLSRSIKPMWQQRDRGLRDWAKYVLTQKLAAA